MWVVVLLRLSVNSFVLISCLLVLSLISLVLVCLFGFGSIDCLCTYVLLDYVDWCLGVDAISGGVGYLVCVLGLCGVCLGWLFCLSCLDGIV